MSVFDKAKNPIVQAALCLGGVFVLILLSKIVRMTGIIPVSERFPWMTAAAFLLLFSIFNTVGSIFSVNRSQYWRRSIYSFIGLALSSGLLAWACSSLSILGYLVFVSIMNIARTIVEFAQREEWNHPRIRQKKR